MLFSFRICIQNSLDAHASAVSTACSAAGNATGNTTIGSAAAAAGASATLIVHRPAPPAVAAARNQFMFENYRGRFVSRIRGAVDIRTVHSCVNQLIRNHNVALKRGEVARNQSLLLGFGIADSLPATHDYYLRARPPADLPVDVDHVFEGQLLTFCILQEDSFTMTQILGQLNVNDDAGKFKSLGYHPAQPRALIRPVYDVHNDLFNLRTLDSSVSRSKGQFFKSFVSDLRSRSGKIDYGNGHGLIAQLERHFEKTRLTNNDFAAGWDELDGLAKSIGSEICATHDTYVDAIRKLGANNQNSRELGTCFEGVADNIVHLFDVMNLDR